MTRIPALDPATIPQVNAANPHRASWVSANAGSGKTKVLTDRVARLLLTGTPPQRILCLTYTTAAASNMQNRLFARLGSWSMLPDQRLREELLFLGEDPDSLDYARLSQARTLFARALETPGGLKIQTIHAFASGILRRFPLEAGVSPNFKSLDERASRMLREDVLDSVSLHGPEEFGDLARFIAESKLHELTEEIAGRRLEFDREGIDGIVCRIFDLEPPVKPPEYWIRRLFAEPDVEMLERLIGGLRDGSTTDRKAARLLEGLNLYKPTVADFNILKRVFLFGPTASTPFEPKIDRFPTQATRLRMRVPVTTVNNYMRRVAADRTKVNDSAAAVRTMVLHRFARLYLDEYDRRKRAECCLDFDDLINKTLYLLSDPQAAQWVLYKLDGGIDHVLVDEAQDVSRKQWRIISDIAEEFTAGRGASERIRTVFAVGDEKQSIYGFQGAAPEKFAEMKALFRDRYEDAGQDFVEEELDYSFRSSRAILEVVDRVFERREEPGFEGDIRHKPYKSSLPGRVDVWPAIGSLSFEVAPDWHASELVPGAVSATNRLARKLALRVKQMVGPPNAEQIAAGDEIRPVRCGDILILVRRRNDLFRSIIIELKAAGLPVAGTDRMVLSESLAVSDIRALLSFIATPSDDLSLATALRSPLFRMTEEELFSIAYGRGRVSLWRSLMASKERFPGIVSTIRDLMEQANRLRPYELIEHLLTVNKGRDFLIARLGKESAEPLDAFLHLAMEYDDEESSSLTGFLEWSSADYEVKRQLDQAGDEIRVMTVHGAKGLESPIVILPDTADRKFRHNADGLLMGEDDFPLWNTAKADRPRRLEEAELRRQQDEANEQLRLLYVALTRAESWLIVAAAGSAGEDSWHGMIQDAVLSSRFETVEQADEQPEEEQDEAAVQEIIRLSYGEWPSPANVKAFSERSDGPDLPEWVHTRPPELVPTRSTRSPSRLGDGRPAAEQAAAAAESSRTQEDAMARGTMIHLLLEHLPAGKGAESREKSMSLLRCAFPNEDPKVFEEAHREAVQILDNPDLAFLFSDSTLAEPGVSANLNGLKGDRILGYIDRLVVEADRILAVDFKSNLRVPMGESDVPEYILRQLGAYHEALEQIYPGRRVEVAVLWTRTAELMNVDFRLCREALCRSGPSAHETDGFEDLDSPGDDVLWPFGTLPPAA